MRRGSDLLITESWTWAKWTYETECVRCLLQLLDQVEWPLLYNLRIQKSSLNNTTIDRMKPKVNIYGNNTNSKWFDLWLSFRPAKQCSTVRFDCWAIRVFFCPWDIHIYGKEFITLVLMIQILISALCLVDVLTLRCPLSWEQSTTIWWVTISTWSSGPPGCCNL